MLTPVRLYRNRWKPSAASRTRASSTLMTSPAQGPALSRAVINMRKGVNPAKAAQMVTQAGNHLVALGV